MISEDLEHRRGILSRLGDDMMVFRNQKPRCGDSAEEIGTMEGRKLLEILEVVVQ